MFLNCHSVFSLRHGVLLPSELVEYAKEYNLSSIALTDINNTSCTFEFYKLCLDSGIKPVIGIEFRQDGILKFIGLAKNNIGFYELNEFLTDCSIHNQSIPAQAPASENCYIIYPFDRKRKYKLLDHEYIGIRPSEVRLLVTSELAKQRHKLVALCSVTFREPDDYTAHRILRCIDLNTVLTKLPSSQVAHCDERFYSPTELEILYELFPELLVNAQRLLDECNVSYDLKAPKNKKSFTGSKKGDEVLLHQLAKEGIAKRYGEDDKASLVRFAEEMAMTLSLDFATYFLIVYDFIEHGHSQGFEHVGRGSGANSLISYAMRITEVDPIQLNLPFERFINPERATPPDFDIDFSHDERDAIIHYLIEKYGKRHVAWVATYTTFRDSSSVREVSKVFGLPKEEIDKMVNHPEAVETHHYLADEILKHAERIMDFPNYLGIHASGILISEEPLTVYSAMQMMPKGFPIVHFDMHVAEDIRFFKFDVLSQRGLGHIKSALHLLARKGIHIDIHEVKKFMEDERVKQMLRSAETIGAFYIESPAMRQLIDKLKCDNYPCLVAASSVIRPGVAQSGMMQLFIDYHLHPEKVEYIHPIFEEHLSETYGIMVYQEDVMMIVHHYGGLSRGKADMVRRGMSGKSRGTNAFELIRGEFFESCKGLGRLAETTEKVWRYMVSFAGYSFCKAHSASFAVQSYQSLFLKAHFPHEFHVAVLNNFGGFYDAEVYLHEARRYGAQVEAPCVNHSDYLYTLHDTTIYIGFVRLKGFQKEVALQIERERQRNGQFKSFEDFMIRVPVKKEQLNILIRIGAFRFTGKTTQQLLWEKSDHLYTAHNKLKAPELLVMEEEASVLPELEVNPYEAVYDQIELLGFPLCSPFDLMKSSFRAEAAADEFKHHVGKTIKLVGYYVDRKTVWTKHNQIMYFGCWIDYKGNYFDTVHFPQTVSHSPFTGRGLYLIRGKVVDEFGHCSLEVERMAMIPMVE